MSKNEAMRAITHLSSGTIAHLTGATKYEKIDAIVCGWIEAVANASDDAFKSCENWMQVLDIIRR